MFEVNRVYANRKGKYTVLAINPPIMSVRYEDGTLADLNIRRQSRIWDNIRTEFEIQEAKAAKRSSRKQSGSGQYFIKAISIPDADELMFPGWQEKIIMSTFPDASQIQVGARIIYYAIEAQTFFAVATITEPAFTASPKDYFFTQDMQEAEFFSVDMDASAAILTHGVRADSIELESCPQFKTKAMIPEEFLEINEDDFELLAEVLTEVSEDEIEEIDDEDEYEELEEEDE